MRFIASLLFLLVAAFQTQTRPTHFTSAAGSSSQKGFITPSGIDPAVVVRVALIPNS